MHRVKYSTVLIVQIVQFYPKDRKKNYLKRKNKINCVICELNYATKTFDARCKRWF